MDDETDGAGPGVPEGEQPSFPLPRPLGPGSPEWLTPAYRLALRLEAAGASPASIAAAVDVPIEAVPALLAIARAKAEAAARRAATDR